MKYRYIAIEGCIGAGKTTLATMLADRFNGQLILEEFTDNSFLEKFYQNRDRYALPLEVSFLVERYQQLEVMLAGNDLFKPVVVSDYLFDKSLVFAQLNLQGDHYKLFKKLFDALKMRLREPDLIIFLHNSINQLQENIAKRGRSYERDIPDKYLQDLQDNYLRYFKRLPASRIVIIDSSKVDFVKSPEDLDMILELTDQDFKKGITTIR